MKKFLNKKVAMLLAAVMVMAMSAIPALAAEGGETGGATDAMSTVATSLQTGFGDIVSSASSIVGQIVVIALPLAGAIFLARKAIGWFRSIAK